MAIESKEIRVMRSMAWERAKGEMRSMWHTYYDMESNKYDEFKVKMDEFIAYIESYELQA